MGGSTGIISKTIILPTTEHAERIRSTESGIASYPGMHEGVRQEYGTIFDIHAERRMIRAFADDGSPIANGRFVPLNHGSLEIAERWGTIRKGMRVLINFTGPDGSRANATITELENERNLNKPFSSNTAQRGLFRIFAPGIGLT